MREIHFRDSFTIIYELLGQTIVDIEGGVGENELVLAFGKDGEEKAVFYHQQDCCETVRIAQIDGDLNDVRLHPITMAEVVVSRDKLDEKPDTMYEDDSWTWSFLKLATVNGYVTVRWLGESNGYYSEDISLRI